MTSPAFPSYAGYRFPAEIISRAVSLYFRFSLSLRSASRSATQTCKSASVGAARLLTAASPRSR